MLSIRDLRSRFGLAEGSWTGREAGKRLIFTTRGHWRTPNGLLGLVQLQVSSTCCFSYLGLQAAGGPSRVETLAARRPGRGMRIVGESRREAKDNLLAEGEQR